MILKLGSVITQGHRNRHGSIRHLWLHSNHGPISYRFRDKRDNFQLKITKSESQTSRFLLAVQLSSGYDDD